MLDEEYAAFTICVVTKLLECEDYYLGMRFVGVHNDMFNRPDGKNYPGASCSFIHEFYLHTVRFKSIGKRGIRNQESPQTCIYGF